MKIIDNRAAKLKKSIKEELIKSDEIIISSPFIRETDILFELLNQNIKVTIICRLSPPASPELFEKILGFLNKNKRFFVYDNDTLHAKIYLFIKLK